MSSQSVKPGPLSSQDWRAGSGVIMEVELSRGQHRWLPPPRKSSLLPWGMRLEQGRPELVPWWSFVECHCSGRKAGGPSTLGYQVPVWAWLLGPQTGPGLVADSSLCYQGDPSSQAVSSGRAHELISAHSFSLRSPPAPPPSQPPSACGPRFPEGQSCQSCHIPVEPCLMSCFG